MSGALGENRPGFNTAVFGGQTLAAVAAARALHPSNITLAYSKKTHSFNFIIFIS